MSVYSSLDHHLVGKSKAESHSAEPTRMQELEAKLKGLYASAEKLTELEPVARRIGIRFANNPEAATLEKSIEYAVADIHGEASRLEEIMACEEISSPKDALLLILATSWRLDNADDDSSKIIENTWNGVTAFLAQHAGVTAQELGYDAIKEARPAGLRLVEKLAAYQRLADMADAKTEKQTREDLRNRLWAILNAIKEGDEEAMTQGQEFILQLEGDDPHLIAAKLIVTASCSISREGVLNEV
jgi:hypothetical protein